MKGLSEWLTDLAVRVVAPRAAKAVLFALVGILADAGLLDGQLAAAAGKLFGS